MNQVTERIKFISQGSIVFEYSYANIIIPNLKLLCQLSFTASIFDCPRSAVAFVVINC